MAETKHLMNEVVIQRFCPEIFRQFSRKMYSCMKQQQSFVFAMCEDGVNKMTLLDASFPQRPIRGHQKLSGTFEYLSILSNGFNCEL
jgi:hypothetical protein